MRRVMRRVVVLAWLVLVALWLTGCASPVGLEEPEDPELCTEGPDGLPFCFDPIEQPEG